MTDRSDLEPLPRTTVTVIVPCYNHEPYLDTLIGSLRKQTFTDFSVVVVDDASTDHSVTAMRNALAPCEFPNRFIEHETNAGVCRTLNDGLRLANSEYIATISSDDWTYPHHLERLVARMDAAGENCAVCYGDVDQVDADGQPLGRSFLEQRLGESKPPEGAVIPDLLGVNFVSPVAAIIRSSAIEQVGSYDPRLLTEDFDMLIRLAARFEFAHVPESLGAYRVLERSLTTRVFRDNRQQSRMDLMASLTKVLNTDPATDMLVARRLRHFATLYYLDGGDPAVSASRFRLVLRYEFAPMALVYLAAAKLRIPGTWFHRAKRLVKRGRFD